MALSTLTELPTPGPLDSPDAPGGFYALAKALQTYILLKNTQQRQVASNTATIMTWDTVMSQPSGDMGNGGTNILLPRGGVYRVHATTTINGGTNATAPWWWDCKIFDSVNGTSTHARKGGFGWVTDAAIDYEAEIIASAGSTLQLEFFQQSGNTSTHPGYTDPTYQQRLFVQYLGKGAS